MHVRVSGDQAANEEGVHAGVFSGQKVNVCVLHTQQGQVHNQQDVC